MGTSTRNEFGRGEIRGSRPGRLTFVGVSVLTTGTAYALILLSFAAGLIMTGLFGNRDISRVGLVFLATAIACPLVAVLVTYNLLLARRWAFVAAFLISLATPVLELAAFHLADGTGWPLRSASGFALVIHVVATLSALSIPILLSPATRQWVARSQDLG